MAKTPKGVGPQLASKEEALADNMIASTPGTLTSNVNKALQAIDRKRDRRRQAYKDAIQALFEGHRLDMQNLNESRQKEMNDLRCSNTSHLIDLLETKSRLESEMSTISQTLINALITTSHELRLVVDERAAQVVDM